MSQEVKINDKGEVTLRYVEPNSEIRNKKNKVVGSRDIIYDAVYTNTTVAINMFKEKIQEYKKSIKELEERNKTEESNIKDATFNLQINNSSIESLKNMIVKSENIVKDIKELK